MYLQYDSARLHAVAAASFHGHLKAVGAQASGWEAKVQRSNAEYCGSVWQGSARNPGQADASALISLEKVSGDISFEWL